MVSCSRKGEVFDFIRSKWVAKTPEEQVRQALLRHMVYDLGFPKEHIVVEQELGRMPHLIARSLPSRRFDIACFAKDIHPEHPFYPLLLVECKALGGRPLEQLMGYNAHVKAYCLAVADERGLHVALLREGSYCFLETLPPYKELICMI